MDWTVLPSLNAVLNTTSAVLLTVGYCAIRRKAVRVHRAFMLAAVGTSTLFLASYLTYHAQVGSVKYPGHGVLRTVYLSILLTHTVLAAAIVPLVGVTLWAALSDRLQRHRRMARVTLPIWMYVSVTGVVIYWMLYHGDF